MNDNIKQAIERLRKACSRLGYVPHGGVATHEDAVYFDDILTVCDYAEKASEVVEAAKEEVDMESSDPEYLPQIRKALASMEGQ